MKKIPFEQRMQLSEILNDIFRYLRILELPTSTPISASSDIIKAAKLANPALSETWGRHIRWHRKVIVETNQWGFLDTFVNVNGATYEIPLRLRSQLVSLLAEVNEQKRIHTHSCAETGETLLL